MYQNLPEDAAPLLMSWLLFISSSLSISSVCNVKISALSIGQIWSGSDKTTGFETSISTKLHEIYYATIDIDNTNVLQQK